MAKVNYSGEKAKFFSVLADGKFHHAVEENHPGAVKREYETSDGKTGVKWDIIADSISGLIESITIREGAFGKQLQIYFSKGEDEPVVVSLSLNSNYAEDFLKKLPNVKRDVEVTVVPYSFEDEKGKNKKGMTVYQEDEKVTGYYHELVDKGDKKVLKAINGYPEVPKEAFSKTKPWDSDDWKMFFTQARKFLVSELEKNPLYRDPKAVPTEAEAELDEITKADDVNPF